MNTYEKIGDNECKRKFKKKIYKVKGEERIMKNVINRKGISLVALVITIIVLVVLTGAVVITGVNVPQQGQLAVFKNNIGNVQDAVTMKMLNNMVNNRQVNNENIKWIGIISGYGEEDIGTAPVFDKKINDVDVAALDVSLNADVSLKNEDFSKYYVDAKGIVYHTGFIYDGIIYYNASTNVQQQEEEEKEETTKTVTSIEITAQPIKTRYIVGDTVDMTGLVGLLTYSNNTTAEVTSGFTFEPVLTEVVSTAGRKEVTVSYGGVEASNKIEIEVLEPVTSYVEEVINGVTYKAPVPLGFSVVTGSISTGLVIEDDVRNQFVWVPVNDSYKMIGDVTGEGTFNNKQSNIPNNTDIPYLANNTTTALEYWEVSANGHSGTITDVATVNEPYENAGLWEITEYQDMAASVLKYGGFYIGRYETGGSVLAPVVKAGVMPITSIKWNDVDTMSAEPASGTATYVSRNMYSRTNSNYGATSTLAYGIQWDSMMCWIGCYNATRELDTYVAKPSTTGAVYIDEQSYDVNKNIYDLVGNVYEWSMEATDSSKRVARSGSYYYANAVSNRNANNNQTNSRTYLGFRIALYIK